MGILIRDANRADLRTIVEFQTAMAMETESLKLDRDILTSGVGAIFDDPLKARYFIAEDNGVIVGMLMVTLEWSDWRNGWMWWIQSVYTAPAFRCRGIYKALYGYVKSIVLESDCVRGVRLYVDKSNIAAQKVYTSLGMNGEHYDTYEWMKDSL